MPRKKPTRKSSKTNKTKLLNLAALWNSTNGRSLIILAACGIAVATVLIVGYLNSSLTFTNTYTYKKGGVDLSFNYPADFTNNTKPTVLGGTDDGTFVAQQSRKDPDGALIGYVRAQYAPSIGANDIEDTDGKLLAALRSGSRSDISNFTTALAHTTFADCTDATRIFTASNKPLIKCKLSGIVGGEYKGSILFGATNKGAYEFDYWIKTSYWSLHASSWNAVYRAIDYN